MKWYQNYEMPFFHVWCAWTSSFFGYKLKGIRYKNSNETVILFEGSNSTSFETLDVNFNESCKESYFLLVVILVLCLTTSNIVSRTNKNTLAHTNSKTFNTTFRWNKNQFSPSRFYFLWKISSSIVCILKQRRHLILTLKLFQTPISLFVFLYGYRVSLLVDIRCTLSRNVNIRCFQLWP